MQINLKENIHAIEIWPNLSITWRKSKCFFLKTSEKVWNFEILPNFRKSRAKANRFAFLFLPGLFTWHQLSALKLFPFLLRVKTFQDENLGNKLTLLRIPKDGYNFLNTDILKLIEIWFLYVQFVVESSIEESLKVHTIENVWYQTNLLYLCYGKDKDVEDRLIFSVE